jgi:hypothetical protein
MGDELGIFPGFILDYIASVGSRNPRVKIMKTLKSACVFSTGHDRRDAVIPNPRLQLMDQVREVLRLRHWTGQHSRAPGLRFSD